MYHYFCCDIWVYIFGITSEVCPMKQKVNNCGRIYRQIKNFLNFLSLLKTYNQLVINYIKCN